MALLLDVLRWTALAAAVLCGLLALLLWWHRPREVAATRWMEPEDGWPAWETREPWL